MIPDIAPAVEKKCHFRGAGILKIGECFQHVKAGELEEGMRGAGLRC